MKKIRPSIDRLVSDIRRIESNPHNEDDLRNVYLNIRRILSSEANLSSKCRIYRNGVISLWDIRWADDSVRNRSELFARKSHNDIDHIISDQFYFFVRDISHNHQHHSPDADTVITTHKYVPAYSPKDFLWAKSIVYSLYFHIINMKRSKDPLEHTRAIGILAYINSFVEIVKTELNCPDLPTFFSDNVKSSIASSSDYVKINIEREILNKQKLTNYGISILAIIFAALSFVIGFSDSGAKTDALLSIPANYIKSHGWFLYLIILLFTSYFISLNFYKNNFTREIMRILIYSKRWSIVALFIFIAALLKWIHFILAW